MASDNYPCDSNNDLSGTGSEAEEETCGDHVTMPDVSHDNLWDEEVNSVIQWSETEVNIEDFRAVEEYRSLVKLYRDLPKDMCISQILRQYHSSECDLESVRYTYFEHLKASHVNFPYDIHASLKRRIQTRTGDPLAARLAQDIYSILEVTEGGDPAILKSMISSGARGKLASVAGGHQPNRTEPPNSKSGDSCPCSAEVKLLKDTVLMLQADVLSLKQTMYANDKLRQEQSCVMKSALLDLKNSMYNCNRSIAECTGSTLSVFRNISNSVMEQLIAIEDRVRSLEVAVDEQPAIHHQQLGVNVSDDVDVGIDVGVDGDVSVNAGTERCINSTDSSNNNSISTPLPTSLPSADTEAVKPPGDVDTSRPSDISPTDNRPESDRGAPIPVLVTNRHKADYGDRSHHVDLDNFTVPTRRHTKRFCVLGLSHSVNINMLARDIQSKGPSISNIRVFPCRRDEKKVVIRLNLLANEESSRVLDAGFWPDYVTCRPWVTRARMRRDARPREMPPRFKARVEHTSSGTNGRDLSQYQFARNKFETLCCDVD